MWVPTTLAYFKDSKRFLTIKHVFLETLSCGSRCYQSCPGQCCKRRKWPWATSWFTCTCVGSSRAPWLLPRSSTWASLQVCEDLLGPLDVAVCPAPRHSAPCPSSPVSRPLVYQCGRRAWPAGCGSVLSPSCGTAELIGNGAAGLNAALVSWPLLTASITAQHFY